MRYLYSEKLTRGDSRKRWILALSITLLVGALVYTGCAYFFVSTSYSPSDINKTFRLETYSPQYPSYGSSGVMMANSNVLYTNNNQPQPMASTAKLVTALTILDTLKDTDLRAKYFTITAEDVALTNAYKNKGGSVASAPLGAQVSYYAALQYMLILSANNFTDIVTKNVFGSSEQYIESANTYLKNNGIHNTVIADASGFNPTTQSTAQDMLRIGSLAVASSVITDITRMRSVVDLSGATQKSTSLFLPSTSGELIGLKTGFTDEAKAVFLNATTLPNGKTIVAVSMGAETPQASQTDTNALVSNIANTQKEQELFAAQQPIATIALPWGKNATLQANETVLIQNIANQDIDYTITLDALNKHTKNGAIVGKLTAKSALSEKSYLLYINDYSPAPLYWRLTHPI